jgi:polyhydroxyalkanoate synthesis regulator phasin
MAQTDLLKRYLDAGVAFTQLTQQKAEEIVRDLVRSGEVQTGDARKRAEELLERSRVTTDGLVALVRSEVQTQITRMGLVPKKELDEVKQQLADLRSSTSAATSAAPAKKAAPAKAAATQAPATKSAAPAAKAPAKKAPAANKSAAKKAGGSAKKAPAAKKAAKASRG